jgi:hypothetical protein
MKKSVFPYKLVANLSYLYLGIIYEETFNIIDA